MYITNPLMLLLQMFKRFLKDKLTSALSYSPAIFINGARQVGKTTLAQQLSQLEYRTLDDLLAISEARDDPISFLDKYPNGLILDEVQKAPELFNVIKMSIDQNRKAGKFILTGSANILTLPRVSESLAGRMQIFTLYPLSMQEINNSKFSWIDEVADEFSIDIFNKQTRNNFNKQDLIERISIGGYPEALSLKSQGVSLKGWFASYIYTIINRDLIEISKIKDVTSVAKLIKMLALNTSNCLNKVEIARNIGVPVPRIDNYIKFLNMLFITYQLEPWFRNFKKRLIRSPKIYFTDTGIANSLFGVGINDNTVGQLLENFVISEIKKQVTWSDSTPQLYFYRTSDGREVDLIIEYDNGQCLALEIKSTSTVYPKHFTGIKAFKEDYDNVIAGIVLYTGKEIVSFGNNLWAVPISCIL